jgi:basic membrane protein A
MNIKTTVHMSLLAATLAASFQAMAADPAVVFDMGGKFDKSFNEAAYTGIEKWKKETGKKYLSFEITNESQREQAIRRMAERGASPIIGIGFGQASSIEKVAKEFPKLQFAIIDMVVDLPNVQSVVFKEQEGSFLVGAMAAMASKTGKVGFVGGMDPARGGELAKAQFSQGVDVVFAAAGGTGIGVYQAAKDSGKLAIGVDSNQNHIQPGTMLTSMLKRVDVAVYNVAKGHKAGISVLGLKEGGVDYAVDANNAKLVTADMKKKVEAAKADIISGKIKVADFMADNACKF